MKITKLILALTLFAACQSPSPRFNHVMLYVSDLERSVEFYTTAFDLEVERVEEIRYPSSDGNVQSAQVRMVFMRFPGQNFVLEISEDTSGDNDRLSHTFQHLGVDVEDIEEAEKKLLAAGARIDNPIVEAHANDVEGKIAFYIGPDGESIELIEITKGTF